MKYLLSIFTVFSLSLLNAQDKKNREAFTLELTVDSEHYYKMEVPQSPFFVKEKVLQIFSGEKIFVETEIKGDTISTMKVVEKIKYPERTIEISFSQDDKDRNNVITTLNVKNPFDKTLKHDALMFTPSSQKWTPTSIIPIRSKLENFEIWPHAIITLVLDNWRLE